MQRMNHKREKDSHLQNKTSDRASLQLLLLSCNYPLSVQVLSKSEYVLFYARV